MSTSTIQEPQEAFRMCWWSGNLEKKGKKKEKKERRKRKKREKKEKEKIQTSNILPESSFKLTEPSTTTMTLNPLTYLCLVGSYASSL